MTVNQLLAELQVLAAEGQGDVNVLLDTDPIELHAIDSVEFLSDEDAVIIRGE